MTTRERKERRIARRFDWANGREKKSDAAYERFCGIADNIPMGQPILVGHHSEGHHRRDLARMDSAMAQVSESSNMAEHHRQKADGIQYQLDTSIYSDDPDVVERLTEKLADLETRRDRMKAINREIRKGAGWSERIAPALTDDEKARLESAAKYSHTTGYPSYALTNLGATIRRTKERLAALQRRPT